jgi:hypothetical protein
MTTVQEAAQINVEADRLFGLHIEAAEAGAAADIEVITQTECLQMIYRSAGVRARQKTREASLIAGGVNVKAVFGGPVLRAILERADADEALEKTVTDGRKHYKENEGIYWDLAVAEDAARSAEALLRTHDE